MQELSVVDEDVALAGALLVQAVSLGRAGTTERNLLQVCTHISYPVLAKHKPKNTIPLDCCATIAAAVGSLMIRKTFLFWSQSPSENQNMKTRSVNLAHE